MCNLLMKKSTERSVNSILFSAFLCGVLISAQVFAGSWSTEYNVEGMDNVHIYLPTTSAAINGKRALMINLHGCGMSSTDMKNNGDWESTADEYGMVVAIPDVPGGGSYQDCWTYYGSSHTRNNNHNDNIIGLAEELMSRSSLNIDPSQVYLTGFSAGGGQANVIACLAPDIFAGVGASAGPSLTTTAYNFGSASRSFSDSSAASTCNRLAGNYDADLDTQIYSTIHGTSDGTIDPDYNTHNAGIMSIVYGSTSQGSSSSIATGGIEVEFSDANGPRVSRITVSYMGHDWSTANGGNSGYFTNTKVDYPNYVTEWFFNNNRRISDPVDADGDGFNDFNDCNDFDNSIFPGAEEICEDGVDQDCDDSNELCEGTAWVCLEYTDTNANHVDASRATSSTVTTSTPSIGSSSGWGSYDYSSYYSGYSSYNYSSYSSGWGSYDYSNYYSGWGSGGSTDTSTTTYYADGSGEELSGTAESTSTVAQTAQGYFEAGSCP